MGTRLSLQRVHHAGPRAKHEADEPKAEHSVHGAVLPPRRPEDAGRVKADAEGRRICEA